MKGIIPAFLAELRQTQFRPREWMVQYQRRLLEPLLRHARWHVPFYRDTGRLDALFRSDHGIDWDRWREIPLLTRKDLQKNFDALKSEVLPHEHGRTWTLTTSGSTGEPVSVVHTSMGGRDAWTAQLLRDFERHRIDPTRRLVFLDPPSADGPHRRMPRGAWYPELGELGLKGERYDLSDVLPASELVNLVADIRPEYMRVQPVALELMCAQDRAGRLGELGLEAVITVGERFSAESKRDVSLHLGCRIMDSYASQECGRIATSCPNCAQFHVDAEVHLVEVVDQGGEATAAGDVGQVIVTPLYNYAMPLIRYDHADQARVGSPDLCPIRLPALDAIYGKVREPFVFPNGAIRPTLSAKVVIEYLGAQAYQVAQVAPDRCEVRFVQGNMTPQEIRYDEMTEYLRAIWWEGLAVDYRIVDALPRSSPRAKIATVVNEAGRMHAPKFPTRA